MSPSHISSMGNSMRKRATQGISVARWIGIAIACASVSPCSVNRLADASSPSFTIGENELLSRVNSISLAIPSSLLRTTSTVTGSSVWVESNIPCPSIGRAFEHEVAVRIDAAAPARRDERRGVVLLDDRRAFEGIARLQRRAVINRGFDRSPLLGQQNA